MTKECIETLQQVAARISERGDQAAALVFGKKKIETWTYAKLADCAKRLAHGLREVGVERGDSVAIFAPNSAEWIAACLGVIRLGAVVVPVDAQFRGETLASVLKDSGAELVFTHRDRLELLEEFNVERKFMPILLDTGGDDERSWQKLLANEETDFPEIGADDIATIFYTSGTTGPPKGVPLSHRNLAFQLETVIDTEFVTADDRLLLPLPLHHVYPFVLGMFAPLALGVAIILPSALTGPQLVRALREGQVTTILAVPRIYSALWSGLKARVRSSSWIARGAFLAAFELSMLLRRAFGIRAGKLLLRSLHKRLGPEVRIAASGGSAIDSDLAWKLEALGWQIAIGYGLTETSPLLTINPPRKAKIGTVGKPLPGVEIRIDPSARSDVNEGRPRVENSSGREEGEILVRGPNVFSGYRSLPDKTKKAFTDDGWFRTGDLGRFDRQGWLYITGRVSTMIVTEGGENIQPENVEAAYERHSEIREIGVLQKDRKLVALVVPEPKGARDPQETIQKALEEISRKLSSYQRISEFAITRDALPRTRLGKLERHRLKERFERAKSGQDKSRKTSGPMSIGEMSGEDRALLDDRATREVWELFARRFKEGHLTPDTNPQIDLGIDSLEWLDLTMEIRTRAGVELSEEAIGRIGTIRDLLREVTEASETESSAAPLDQPEEAMTESQKRWLEPRGPLMSLLAHGLCVFNRLLMKVFFRVEAKGLEHLRGKEHFVLTPNHVSYLDPFAIAATLSYSELCRTHWGGWTAILAKNFLTRFLSRLAGAVPLDAERAVVSSLAFGAMVLQREKNLVWFSEGGRSADGKLQPFKPGIGLLLRRFPAPVVPTFIEGAHDVLPPGKLFPRLKKITIVFGKPLDPRMLEREGSGEQPYHRIASALRDRVERLGREKAHQS